MTQARPDRPAGGLAVAWGAVMLGWAVYNCFWQVGFATFAKGVFYYGGSSVGAETGSLNFAVLYLTSGILLLRGRDWARGVVVGVALVEGYNRVRSLTGALLDAPQRRWFTGTTEGWLKLATFGLGVAVTATLAVLLVVSLRRTGSRWAPAPGPWAAAGQPSPFQPLPVQQGQQPGQLHWSLLQTLPQDQAPGHPPTQPQQPAQAWPQPQQAPQPQQPPQPQQAPQPPHDRTQPGWTPPPAAVPPQPPQPQHSWPAPPVTPGPVPPAPGTPPYPG
ncbi:hypothetical protein ACFWA9_20355 [Kitasatospora sp. NPDC059973]|uniref:hypothetical protein n=1 Tax=Kitasatospora sp. NPDC059973 TaxID=3347020 RepID=UPI0036C02BD1